MEFPQRRWVWARRCRSTISSLPVSTRKQRRPSMQCAAPAPWLRHTRATAVGVNAMVGLDGMAE
ncbi:hypothetical protein DF147_15275 [Burkholderia cenocepacia]|nr:hypothetical protein DF147_15275 [Burkholderia cenocepacia]RQV87526.1 hypothetical protein DF019_23590 [Burkholderia cenocepacia]